MTEGARRAFRHMKIGYVVLAIGTIVGIWAATNHADTRLRHDINALGHNNCLNSRATLRKYNDLVDSNIKAQQEAKILNLSQGDGARAALNIRNIQRLKKDKLHIPTDKECMLDIFQSNKDSN